MISYGLPDYASIFSEIIDLKLHSGVSLDKLLKRIIKGLIHNIWKKNPKFYFPFSITMERHKHLKMWIDSRSSSLC